MKPWIMFTKHLEGYSLQEIMDGLKAATVDGADLCVRPGYPVHPDNAKKALPEASRQFADAGLAIPLITTPGDCVDAGLPYVPPLFEACAEAGVKFVKLGYWHMGEDGYWSSIDRYRKCLEEFAKLAEQTGVKPVIHNHSGSSMGLNSSSVMNLVRDFDPAHVGVYADVGHLSIVGEPYPMALDIVKEYLSVIAFKDLVRQSVMVDGKPQWTVDVVPLGTGFGDFPTVLNTLKKINYTGPISFHCEYGRLPPESVIDQCRMDTRFIRGLGA
jgi:sugar phosphate isomerase/epimerase